MTISRFGTNAVYLERLRGEEELRRLRKLHPEPGSIQQ